MPTDPDRIAVLRDGAITAAYEVQRHRDTLDDYLRRLALDEPLTTPPMGADPREVIERLEAREESAISAARRATEDNNEQP